MIEKILFICLFLHNVEASIKEDSFFYTHKAKDIETGQLIDFNAYRDKVVLIVNVASECGYTDGNYKELVQMQKKYNEDFVILAFPCNQFGKQEPKKNKYILKYALQKHKINFPMFAKINVVGQHAHPLYRWLKVRAGEEPSWNFSMYLLNRKGGVERYANAWTPPWTLETDILDLLHNKPLKGGILLHDTKEEL